MTDASLGANDYYWNIDLYWDSTNYITSLPFPFFACDAINIVFSPAVPTTITKHSYQFKGTYSQVQLKKIKWWTMTLYDSGGNELDNSNDVHNRPTYNNNIKYTFDGMLNNVRYGVRINGENELGVLFDTGIEYFDVVYTAPTVTIATPTATLREDGSIYVDWGHIAYILGSVTGSSSYVSDFNYTGNYALHLGTGAYVIFAVDVLTSTFTYVANIKMDSTSFTGDILKIYDAVTSDYISIGYNGTRWYVDKNGTIEYDVPEILTTNNYEVAIKSDGTDIYQYHRAIV